MGDGDSGFLIDVLSFRLKYVVDLEYSKKAKPEELEGNKN